MQIKKCNNCFGHNSYCLLQIQRGLQRDIEYLGHRKFLEKFPSKNGKLVAHGMYFDSWTKKAVAS